MRETAPCKGCTIRHTACHDSCPAYKEWAARYQAQQKHIRENRKRNQVPWTIAREKAIRKYRKSGVAMRDNGGVK